MSTTTKTLKLAFQNGKGKSTSLTLANALDNLEEDKIKDAMSKIANANVFEKDGVTVYATPVSAAYIERTVTPVFDDSEAVKAADAE